MLSVFVFKLTVFLNIFILASDFFKKHIRNHAKNLCGVEGFLAIKCVLIAFLEPIMMIIGFVHQISLKSRFS